MKVKEEIFRAYPSIVSKKRKKELKMWIDSSLRLFEIVISRIGIVSLLIDLVAFWLFETP